ncbi:MAG TPA: CHASE3 domain-containing protein [Bauldia sp.]|nr:CHASE3 domain-containing protein [Bauldia sp.]
MAGFWQRYVFGRWGRTATYAGILAAAFALVLVAGTAAVYMAMRSADADRLVTQSYQVRQIATRLLSVMQDAETGQRGYLLTNDESYLAPYNDARTSIAQISQTLESLTANETAQHTRVENLKPLVAERFDLLAQTIALNRAGQTDAARGFVASGRGKAVMDSVRSVIDAINDDERQTLTERQGDAAMARGWLLGLVIGSLAAAVALATFLARTAQGALAEARARARELEGEIALRRETQETLRQAQKIEAVGQLTGGIAHDFNNLLTIIMGNLDTLRRRIADTPEQTDIGALSSALTKPLDLAQQGARSAAQLTHRLLAFSRRQALDPARIDMNRLVTGMSDLLRRTLGENVNVETILAGGLWPTFADTNQLENALINLCVNARDAMPEGGRLTIETANTYLDDAYSRQFGDVAAGQYAMLSVTDTGGGIPPDLLARTFEPFFTTKPAGQGSGLGLAMVHGFVKQSGGHVRIYSEVGQGTTVKLYLPRLLKDDEPAAAPAPRPATDGAAPRAAARETILLVEDNEGVRDFARDALTDLGYTVLEAADAETALRLVAEETRIDLLFTDVVLPGMSGRELANRATALRPDLPVLFTTGYTRNAIIHHGRLDPGVQLLSKPFAQHDLARKVREMLDGRG